MNSQEKNSSKTVQTVILSNAYFTDETAVHFNHVIM